MSSEYVDHPPVLGLAQTLLKSSKIVLAELAKAASDKEITPDEWFVLDALAVSGQHSMAELASFSLSSGATLTRTIDNLVSRALVYREVSSTDRRKVEVHISDYGLLLHADLQPRIDDLEARLRSDTKDYVELVESLNRLIHTERSTSDQ